MTEWSPTPEFEEEIRRSFQVPPVRAQFRSALRQDLAARARHDELPLRRLSLRPVWWVLAVVVIAALFTTLLLGPQQVYAAVRRLFGYVPNVGIIEQQAGIRVLAQPASQTREGVTVSVNQAVLTDTETHILFGVAGVPLSAYGQLNNETPGCSQPAYLRLPDGSRLEINAPVPADVSSATFVLPCIQDTLPGKAPEQWEFPLQFIAAPADFELIPVQEVTRPATATPLAESSSTQAASSAAPASAAVTVEQVIETADGFILLGRVIPQIPAGSWLQITGGAVIRDAKGQSIAYTIPLDAHLEPTDGLTQGGGDWALQFKTKDVHFPVSIAFTGVVLTATPDEAEITLDVGAQPQPEQTWNVNQEISLGAHVIRLVSVTAEADGYSFELDLGGDHNSVSVSIAGSQAVGSGGGARFAHLVYTQVPVGVLTIRFTNLTIGGQAQAWQADWQPDSVPTAADDSAPAVCFDAASLAEIPALPAGLDGYVYLTQTNPLRQIVSMRMNGSDQQVIAADAARSALNSEGSLLAYLTADNLVIQRLDSAETELIPGTFGYNLRWSPDSSRLALVNANGAYGIFILDRETRTWTQVSNLGYETIAGWSPDGSTLYYAIPDSSGAGFLLKSVAVNGENTRDVTLLEDSSLKAPLPALSPDGSQVAYRGSDNASLYVKALDGSPARRVLDAPAQAINGIVWEREGYLLGVSLITSQSLDGESYLIALDSCESYRLPGVSGRLDGIFIP
jgi:hypothetical protein